MRDSALPREQMVIATKVYFPLSQGQNTGGLSRKHIMDAIGRSLERLGLDYVDLYQIHRLDLNTPMEEILAALDDVVTSGKARYLGASSMYAWQFAQLLHLQERHGFNRFVSMQNHYNLIYREEEREMIPLCRDAGVGLIPWSPLARGFITGNRQRQSDGGRGGATSRAQSDELAQKMYYQDDDFCGGRRRQRRRQRARRRQCPDRLGLDITATRHHRAHHRRDQNVASRGRSERSKSRVERGGTCCARRRLSTASRARPLRPDSGRNAVMLSNGTATH